MTVLSVFEHGDNPPPAGTVFARQNVDDNHCFLCGEQLTEDNRTDEHVIPEWLQRRFNLWNQQLVLLNGTGIPYHRLKIPCCRLCNNKWLGQLENEVAEAAASGFERFRRIPYSRLMLWCSKIYYGILYRETQLLHDRASPEQGTIVGKDYLSNLYTLHLFLQGLHVPFYYQDFVPHSLFVVETRKVPYPFNFDLSDMVAATGMDGLKMFAMLGLRFDDIGIICVFLDNGAQKQYYQDSFDKFDGVPLIPIQFVEFFCKSACKEYSRILPSRYDSWSDRNTVGPCVTQVRTPQLSGPIWGKFDDRLYCQFLLNFGSKFLSLEVQQELQHMLESTSLAMHPSYLFDDKERALKFDDGELKVALYLPPSARPENQWTYPQT